MFGEVRTPSSQVITVFGGSGFLGRYVVGALVKRGYRVRVAVRRPELANFLQVVGSVGQIHAVQANLRFPDSIGRAAEGADGVINLVGILGESGRQRFKRLHGDGARLVAEATPRAATLVHVSAIGADPDSPSVYARSKAEGEDGVRQVRPDAVILRPSVIFGPGDSFFNRFAALARALPVLPLAGSDTRFQPVFAADVSEAVVRGIEGRIGGGVYELGGPEVRTLRELVEMVLAATGRRRLLLALPPGAARLQARVLEIVDLLTLGLLPNELRLTRDQVALLQRDNVVSEEAKANGRTLEGIGILPSAPEAIVPSYLVRFRKKGQFDVERAA